jgi:hypothetical protein
MKLVRLSLAACLSLIALFEISAISQATPLGGPIIEMRTEVRTLQGQFAEFVELLEQLNLELYDNEDQDGDGEVGLRDLLIEALNAISTLEEGDAWTAIRVLEAVVTVHHRVTSTTYHEIHGLIAEIMESVGELEGIAEGLIESGKISKVRGQKIGRKLDTVDSNVLIIQDTFMALEAKMEDGDEGEPECMGVGTANCFDDVLDFLYLAIDTISGSMSIEKETIEVIIYHALEYYDIIIEQKDGLFKNLQKIARALKEVDSELRKAQGDLRKGNKSNTVNFESGLSKSSSTMARVELFDLRGNRILNTAIQSAHALSAVENLVANGVYLYVLTQTDANGNETKHTLGRLIVKH